MRRDCFRQTNARPSWIALRPYPTCGVIVPGGSGIRKVRFGFGSRGKSGGARIIYLFSGESLPVFVLAVFAKNEKANLSMAERNALARLVTDMVRNYRRQK